VIHHIVAKGSAGEWIVRDDRDREVLLQLAGETVRRYRWKCLAYCFLSTHFHLLVATPAMNLGTGMQRLLSVYARAFNERHERQGNLFHTRFYSREIASESHLIAAVVYVLLNPVRAGVVDDPERWPWSSYAATVGMAKPPDFLSTRDVLELVAGDAAGAPTRLRLLVAEARALDAARTWVRHGV
jgi:REP element-mobilizing transposase RayT